MSSPGERVVHHILAHAIKHYGPKIKKGIAAKIDKKRIEANKKIEEGTVK